MTRNTKILISMMAVTVLCLLGIGGIAHAQASPPVPDDGSSFLALIMTGKYLAGVGAFLILFVQAVKAGGSKLGIAWLKTKAGGYVLGFGSAVALYLGAALESGQSVTAGLFAAALAAGWTAAGGWEHLGDLLSWLRPPAASTPIPVAQTVSPRPGTSTVIQASIIMGSAIVCLFVGSALIQACGPAKNPTVTIIDCTKADAAQTAALLDELKPLLAGNSIDWTAVEAKAVSAGETIGGCVLATIVQDTLGGTKATPVDNSWAARTALEDFRSHHANGAIFHFANKDL